MIGQYSGVKGVTRSLRKVLKNSSEGKKNRPIMKKIKKQKKKRKPRRNKMRSYRKRKRLMILNKVKKSLRIIETNL